MEVTKILKCPKTGNKLRFDDADSIVVVEESPITYPIIGGIIDFCPEARDAISASYDGFSSHYDAYMTSSNVFMKLFNMLVWGNGNDFDCTEKVLS